jgi:hypothetical protein
VRGIRLRNPEETYDFDLILDIDHILRWMKSPSGEFGFVVAPASLAFHYVNQLVLAIKLAYKENLKILKIEREEVTTEGEKGVGLRKWNWRIDLVCLSGGVNTISFQARGFTQQLTREPIVTLHQSIDEGG